MNKLSKTKIRVFREADLIPVQRLIHHTIDVCYSGIYPPRAVQFFKEFHSEENIAKRYQEGDILVSEQDNNVVATGTLVGREIFGVFVHPVFQHRGLGAALMSELENRARSKGCTESELSVSLPSRGFYEGLGYEMIEKCSIDVGKGERLDFWKSRKALIELKF